MSKIAEHRRYLENHSQFELGKKLLEESDSPLDKVASYALPLFRTLSYLVVGLPFYLLLKWRVTKRAERTIREENIELIAKRILNRQAAERLYSGFDKRGYLKDQEINEAAAGYYSTWITPFKEELKKEQPSFRKMIDEFCLELSSEIAGFRTERGDDGKLKELFNHYKTLRCNYPQKKVASAFKTLIQKQQEEKGSCKAAIESYEEYLEPKTYFGITVFDNERFFEKAEQDSRIKRGIFDKKKINQIRWALLALRYRPTSSSLFRAGFSKAAAYLLKTTDFDKKLAMLYLGINSEQCHHLRTNYSPAIKGLMDAIEGGLSQLDFQEIDRYLQTLSE